MKKLKNLKARLLSLSLAFAMVLSLAMGMAPMNVHADEIDTTENTQLTVKKMEDGNYEINGVTIGSEVPDKWVYTELYDNFYQNFTVAAVKEGFKSQVSLTDALVGYEGDVFETKVVGNNGIISIEKPNTTAIMVSRVMEYDENDNIYEFYEMAWIDLPTNVGDTANSSLGTTSGGGDQGGGTENPPTEHTHTWVEDSWEKDDYEHWIICSGCTEVKDKVEHSWEQGVDERFHWGYCSVCGYEENKLEHYEDDTTNNDYMCDYCKYALPCDRAWRVTIDSRNFDGNLEGYARDINDNQIVFNREGHRFFIGEVSALNVLKGSKIDLITNAECTIAVEGSCGEINSFIGGETGDRFVYQIMNISGDITIVLNPQAPAPTPTPNPTPNPDNGSNGGSNGGSSSSSDSSSTPSTTTPAPSTAPITVPVSNGANDNVVHINASVSGETAKVSELTAEEINKVANNETEKSIEINLSETGKNVKEAALPVSSLNEIARIMDDPNNKLDNITIKLSTATVEVSEHTLKAVLSKTTGNDLRLVVDDVHKDTLNDTQKESVKNQNVHMCIDAYFISNGVRIGDFQGGTATIRLPFNVPEGHNRNGFSVWYIGDDGTIEKHDTQYVNGELVFTVSHFSDYVVVYDGAVKDNVPKTGESTDYTFILWTSILAIGVLGLVLNRQKRRQ